MHWAGSIGVHTLKKLLGEYFLKLFTLPYVHGLIINLLIDVLAVDGTQIRLSIRTFRDMTDS